MRRRSSKKPAMEPMTIPAMAPLEREDFEDFESAAVGIVDVVAETGAGDVEDEEVGK